MSDRPGEGEDQNPETNASNEANADAPTGDLANGAPEAGEHAEHGDAVDTAAPNETAPDSADAESERDPRDWGATLRKITTGTVSISLLAVVVALAVGAVLIAFADERVRETAGYLTARPGDFIGATWDVVTGTYLALFRGAIYNYNSDTLSHAIRPLTETAVFATPLILAGLSVALAFRAGLFNIGAQGQIIVGSIAVTYVGFNFSLPVGLHLIVAVLGGLLGGAIYGAIPGVLKARFGANEVIVTIMLNYIAIQLINFTLRSGPFNQGGTGQRSPNVSGDARYPRLIPDDWFAADFRLHAGIIVALLAAVFVWWLLERSTFGFELRATGANPHAGRTAGMSVGRVTILTMVIAGGLAGLAATSQILGTEGYLTAGVAGSLGFDAITVALLGRSKPLGVIFAGLLFGAFRAGAGTMQAANQTPVDIILVLQSVIVLLIAAPPLVRAIFFLPDPEKRRKTRRKPKEVAA